MIEAELLERVFHIRVGNATGTAFAIDVDNRQYLVTAKHVIRDLTEPPTTLRLFERGAWRELDVARVWSPSHPSIDVAVLPLTVQLAHRQLLTLSPSGLALGQLGYFVGFPLGKVGRRKLGQDVDYYPLAFVKRAAHSAMQDDGGGRAIFWLDGHCNKGFSGGPFAFHVNESRLRFQIAGIVRGYHQLHEVVKDRDGVPIDKVALNAGLIVAHDIGWAVEGARACGDGVKVDG